MPKKNRNATALRRGQRNRNAPMIPNEHLEQQLRNELSPAVLGRAQLRARSMGLRSRVLNVAAMAAVVLAIVYRKIPSLHQAVETLEREGLLWLESLSVSVSALSKRFETLPSEIFAELFEQMLEERRSLAPQTRQRLKPQFAHLLDRFSHLTIVDASTLERLRKTTAELREHTGSVLGGKLLMIVDAMSHQPLHAFFKDNAAANEKTFSEEIIAALKPASDAAMRALAVLDAGFFSYPLFEALTANSIAFVTRMISSARVEVIETLSEGRFHRDQIVQLGSRSNPCAIRLRMVSVLWGRTWYRYVTNELDPRVLSAPDVAALYRSRWRIEDAYNIVKRLLDMHLLWVSTSNGVQVQIIATMIIYSAVIDICSELAIALDKPLEKVSVEKVFRTLYHFGRSEQRGEGLTLIEYYTRYADLHRLIKADRNRHRERDDMIAEIWKDHPITSIPAA